MSRRRHVGLILALLFVVLPLVEVYVIVQVGQVIGAFWTITLLVVDSVLGAMIVRREGARAWRALVETLSAGRLPARELADGGLVLIGGTLLLTPGFVTDAFGALLVLPVTRPLFRGALTEIVAARIASPRARRPGSDRTRGDVVEGEVVDPEKPED
ncbi:FxsA family protein [Nocardioides acrostichi]|uniref:FxsA family protein n=1 Tax=Nocardioides acrostichi TaxID=2784339 RepID=A0A930YB26_9ACTN|nr:FxsA family protein [Nocardioides acrostichi]MBF4162008.1 FxsA family protein [Nocardioides acrostichi]